MEFGRRSSSTTDSECFSIRYFLNILLTDDEVWPQTIPRTTIEITNKETILKLCELSEKCSTIDAIWSSIVQSALSYIHKVVCDIMKEEGNFQKLEDMTRSIVTPDKIQMVTEITLTDKCSPIVHQNALNMIQKEETRELIRQINILKKERVRCEGFMVHFTLVIDKYQQLLKSQSNSIQALKKEINTQIEVIQSLGNETDAYGMSSSVVLEEKTEYLKDLNGVEEFISAASRLIDEYKRAVILLNAEYITEARTEETRTLTNKIQDDLLPFWKGLLNASTKEVCNNMSTFTDHIIKTEPTHIEHLYKYLQLEYSRSIEAPENSTEATALRNSIANLTTLENKVNASLEDHKKHGNILIQYEGYENHDEAQRLFDDSMDLIMGNWRNYLTQILLAITDSYCDIGVSRLNSKVKVSTNEAQRKAIQRMCEKYLGPFVGSLAPKIRESGIAVVDLEMDIFGRKELKENYEGHPLYEYVKSIRELRQYCSATQANPSPKRVEFEIIPIPDPMSSLPYITFDFISKSIKVEEWAKLFPPKMWFRRRQPQLEIDLESQPYTVSIPLHDIPGESDSTELSELSECVSPFKVDSATHFAWMYPSEKAMSYQSKKDDPIYNLLFTGAFLFFKDMKLVSVCGINFGGGSEDVKFDNFLHINDSLNSSINWHNVTLPIIIGSGAKMFSWIRPGLVDSIPSGGFAYHHPDYPHFDRIFPVKP